MLRVWRLHPARAEILLEKIGREEDRKVTSQAYKPRGSDKEGKHNPKTVWEVLKET